jgi:hypothetical protein
MTTKKVKMAEDDPATGKRVVRDVEVEIVRVNIRNCDLQRTGGRGFTDVALGDVVVKFKPGEVKTLVISETMATRIKRREQPGFELVNTPPTSAVQADDADDREPTSSEASAMAAEQHHVSSDDAPVERVQRVRRSKEA